MGELRAFILEDQPERVLRSDAELSQTLDEAAAQAREAKMLNIIHLSAPNGDHLSLVVGGHETVLCFNYGHGNPPYFASSGIAEADEPFLTAFASLMHHTEFSRRSVVPMSEGRRAASEFLLTGVRPSAVKWMEV
jgi:hypothetical protein